MDQERGIAQLFVYRDSRRLLTIKKVVSLAEVISAIVTTPNAFPSFWQYSK